MLDKERLEAVLELQERSYRLLRWIDGALRERTIRFDVMHGAMSTAEAAEEWLARHLASLPFDARPAPVDLPAFASLLASYLTTSFEPAMVQRSWNGCYCGWCAHVRSVPGLRPRKVTRHARESASELEALHLRRLARSLGVDLAAGEVERLAADPDVETDLALATYAHELVRRTEFRSQGPGVLALWRRFAWNGNRRVKGFRLRAKAVLAAEERLARVLRTATAAH